MKYQIATYLAASAVGSYAVGKLDGVAAGVGAAGALVEEDGLCVRGREFHTLVGVDIFIVYVPTHLEKNKFR